jgi:hypothetical protein
MTLPFAVAVKNLLGLYVLTPFEQELLKRLSESLELSEREILAYQAARFTSVRRLLKHLDDPKAYGFTNFYTTRFGKSVTDERQKKRFASNSNEALLATAHVRFKGGEIEVQFWLVHGVLFSLEYRSPQNVYYPPDGYRIESMTLSPRPAQATRPAS